MIISNSNIQIQMAYKNTDFLAVVDHITCKCTLIVVYVYLSSAGMAISSQPVFSSSSMTFWITWTELWPRCSGRCTVRDQVILSWEGFWMPFAIRCVNMEPFQRQTCLNEKIYWYCRLKGSVRFKSEAAG